MMHVNLCGAKRKEDKSRCQAPVRALMVLIRTLQAAEEVSMMKPVVNRPASNFLREPAEKNRRLLQI